MFRFGSAPGCGRWKSLVKLNLRIVRIRKIDGEIFADEIA